MSFYKSCSVQPLRTAYRAYSPNASAPPSFPEDGGPRGRCQNLLSSQNRHTGQLISERCNRIGTIAVPLRQCNAPEAAHLSSDGTSAPDGWYGSGGETLGGPWLCAVCAWSQSSSEGIKCKRCYLAWSAEQEDIREHAHNGANGMDAFVRVCRTREVLAHAEEAVTPDGCFKEFSGAYRDPEQEGESESGDDDSEHLTTQLERFGVTGAHTDCQSRPNEEAQHRLRQQRETVSYDSGDKGEYLRTQYGAPGEHSNSVQIDFREAQDRLNQLTTGQGDVLAWAQSRAWGALLPAMEERARPWNNVRIQSPRPIRPVSVAEFDDAETLVGSLADDEIDFGELPHPQLNGRWPER